MNENPYDAYWDWKARQSVLRKRRVRRLLAWLVGVVIGALAARWVILSINEVTPWAYIGKGK